MLKYSYQILLAIALPRKRNGIVGLPSFLSLGSFIIYAYNEDKNYWLIQVAYREHLYIGSGEKMNETNGRMYKTRASIFTRISEETHMT